MDETDLFARLRDISLPDAPPEPSPLLAIAAVAALLIALMALAVLVAARRNLWGREARAVLRSLGTRRDAEAVSAMATLLRRIAILKRGGAVARLTGDAWLAELDSLFMSRFFTRGPGRIFGAGLYGTAAPDAALAPTLSRLVRRRSLLPW